jgi:hypothetical protein
VFHVANDPVNGRGPSFAKGPGGDYKLKGTFYDGMYLQTSEIPLFYENPLGGDYQKFVGGTYHAMEIFNTVVPESELRNPNKDKADDVMIAWTRISKFLPWMRMGDRAGWCIFSGTGKKINCPSQCRTKSSKITPNTPKHRQLTMPAPTKPLGLFLRRKWLRKKQRVQEKKSKLLRIFDGFKERTCLNFLFPKENEVLLMTFEPKLTNRSSATKRIFGLKGR